MITLLSLETLLTNALGTSETNLYTPQKRISAINRAISQYIQQYAIPQYLDTVTLAFVNGIADAPSDLLRQMKLWDQSQNLVFTLINQNQFDNNQSSTWALKYNTVTDTEQIYIYPTTATSLSFRYVKMPVALVAAQDSVRLKDWWAEPIAELAAFYLFVDTRNFNAAEAKKAVSDNLAAKAWQIEANRYDGANNLYLESVFDGTSPFIQRSPYNPF